MKAPRFGFWGAEGEKQRTGRAPRGTAERGQNNEGANGGGASGCGENELFHAAGTAKQHESSIFSFLGGGFRCLEPQSSQNTI